MENTLFERESPSEGVQELTVHSLEEAITFLEENKNNISGLFLDIDGVMCSTGRAVANLAGIRHSRYFANFVKSIFSPATNAIRYLDDRTADFTGYVINTFPNTKFLTNAKFAMSEHMQSDIVQDGDLDSNPHYDYIDPKQVVLLKKATEQIPQTAVVSNRNTKQPLTNFLWNSSAIEAELSTLLDEKNIIMGLNRQVGKEGITSGTGMLGKLLRFRQPGSWQKLESHVDGVVKSYNEQDAEIRPKNLEICMISDEFFDIRRTYSTIKFGIKSFIQNKFGDEVVAAISDYKAKFMKSIGLDLNSLTVGDVNFAENVINYIHEHHSIPRENIKVHMLRMSLITFPRFLSAMEYHREPESSMSFIDTASEAALEP